MVDFFKEECKQKTSSTLFGIGDKGTEPAFINEGDKTLWIAEVENDNAKTIDFYSIDNCVEILRPNGEMEKSCDGLLRHEKNIDFVELKVVKRQWIAGGVEQLKTTIEIFAKNYDLGSFKKRRAFLCNRKHPHSLPIVINPKCNNFIMRQLLGCKYKEK